MPRGGVRKPANPAPVSTPGSGARTDGGQQQTPRYMPGLGYRKGKILNEQENQAALAGPDTSTKTAPTPTVGAPAAAQPSNQPVSFQRLSELPSGPDLSQMRPTASAGTPMADPMDDSINILKALYLRNPSNQDLRRLVTAATQGAV